MIKLVLKHWIIDFCISNFFEKIFKNFNIEKPEYNIGDCFELTVYVLGDDSSNEARGTFKKCKMLAKKNNRQLVISYDIFPPLYFVMENNDIIYMSEEQKDSFDDYFSDVKAK